MRRLTLLCMAAAVAVMGLAGGASAQSAYPNQSINLVIPYPPGGSEALGRRIAQTMSANIGQSIVVENVPGASTQVASLKIKQAKPDGYTMYVSSPPDLAMGPAFYSNLAFDPLKDFTLVTYYAEAPYMLLVNPNLPVKNYKEFVDYLSANPDKVRFGSYGPLSQVDILARRFKKETGIDFDIIPYPGGGPTFTALMAGEVDAVFATPIPTRGFIKDGKMLPVAVTTANRSKLFPDVPTLKEVGLNIEDAASYGIAGPVGLPKEVSDFWLAEWTKAMKDPETLAFIESLGVQPVKSSPEHFRETLTKNTEAWAKLANDLGIDKQK